MQYISASKAEFLCEVSLISFRSCYLRVGLTACITSGGGYDCLKMTAARHRLVHAVLARVIITRVRPAREQLRRNPD